MEKMRLEGLKSLKSGNYGQNNIVLTLLSPTKITYPPKKMLFWSKMLEARRYRRVWWRLGFDNYGEVALDLLLVSTVGSSS